MENGMFLHVGPPTIRLLPVELLLTPNRRPLVFRPKLSQLELEQLLRSLKSLVGQHYDTIRVYNFIARLALSSWFGATFPMAAKRLALPSANQEDLVYDNSRLPLASAVRASSGEGTSLSPEAEQIAAAARTRQVGSPSRIATIGGRDADRIDHQLQSVTDDAVICTDAILPRLLNASAEWRAALGISSSGSSSPSATPLSRGAAALRKRLDYFQLRSWSINDVFSFSALRPDLLTRIRLPPVTMPKEFADLDTPPQQNDPNINHTYNNNNNIATFPTTMSIFQTTTYKRIDEYLGKNHPHLRDHTKQMEELMNQVYLTTSPLYRTFIQLYAYTMKRLPLQLQTAIRVYIFLIVLKQLLKIWRGYVLLHRGVTLVSTMMRRTKSTITPKTGILRRITPFAQRGANMTAAAALLADATSSNGGRRGATTKILANMMTDAILPEQMRPNLDAERKRWFRRRSASPKTTRIFSSSPSSLSLSPSSVSSPSSSPPRTRSPVSAQWHASRLLSNPQAHRVVELVVDQLLPMPDQQASRLVTQVLKEVAAGSAGQRNGQRWKQNNNSTSNTIEDNTNVKDDDTHSSARIASILTNVGLKAISSSPSTSSSPTSSSPASASAASTVLDGISHLTSSSSAASSSLSPLPSGRKRAALISVAKTGASIAFPRMTRLVRFTKNEIRQQNNKQTMTTTPTPTALPTISTILNPVPSSSSRSLSPGTERSIRFAAQHPHLQSAFEQGKLLLFAAIVAQFTERIRSAL